MRNRRGFSLMEIILASGILLACLVVLGQLASQGRHHIEDIETLSTAELACQTRLNELLCGAVPLSAVENEPLAELPGWVVSVQVEPLERRGVSALRVTVSEEPDEESAAGEERPSGPRFTLVRWIRASESEAAADGGEKPQRLSPDAHEFLGDGRGEPPDGQPPEQGDARTSPGGIPDPGATPPPEPDTSPRPRGRRNFRERLER